MNFILIGLHRVENKFFLPLVASVLIRFKLAHYLATLSNYISYIVVARFYSRLSHNAARYFNLQNTRHDVFHLLSRRDGQ